jgi:sodium-coupled neutral amino acid transporter 11
MKCVIPSTTTVKKAKRSNLGERSPFFHPSVQSELIPTTTAGKATTEPKQKQKRLSHERKSGISGTSANLAVKLFGAGIVGIPYAVKKSGLVAGLLMTIMSAVACDKSLRLLIETAKHIDVTSYETLFEAAFGASGFNAMCAIMFTNSYGAMVSYLMIIKDMFSVLLGMDQDDEPMKRAVMVIATLLVIFPLSSQRDMADLAKTSSLSALCYLCLVLYIAVCSPVASSVQSHGGWKQAITIIHPETFFAGFGVLTFAFVCQHAAFIMAGSLERPTKERWAKVTHISLTFAGTLAVICGATGYLGFFDETDGNILVSMATLKSQLTLQINKVAQAMLLLCMFFVYPMDAFVLRHVSMVLIFKGRAAHGGIDHLVLARSDRRILLTFALYMLTLLPALLLTNLGAVLSITGSVAGSALSFIGPGASYLAVHGAEFKKLVNSKWTWGNPDRKADVIRKLRLSCGKQVCEIGPDDVSVASLSCALGIEDEAASPLTLRENTLHVLQFLLGRGAWYLLLMPIWMMIADYGQRNLLDYAETEAMKTPLPVKPLGKITHRRALSEIAKGLHTPDFMDIKKETPTTEKTPLLQVKDMLNLDTHPLLLKRSYSIPDILKLAMDDSFQSDGNQKTEALLPGDVDRAIGAAIVARANALSSLDREVVESEVDPQADFPKVQDFCLAAAFITLGFVAMVAGVYSVFAPSS